MEPLDVVPKPIKRDRLLRVLEKAHLLIVGKGELKNEESELFYVEESAGQIKLAPYDIIYVTTDDTDRRHKHIVLRNGRRHKLLYCTLQRLLDFSPNLIQVNKSEAVSAQAIYGINSGLITLDGVFENGKAKKVMLSKVYKKKISESILL